MNTEMGGARERLAGQIPPTPGTIISLESELTALKEQLDRDRQVAEVIGLLCRYMQGDAAAVLEAADRLVEIAARQSEGEP